MPEADQDLVPAHPKVIVDVAIQTILFDLGDTLVQVGTRSWLPRAKEILASLVQRGFFLGIISNTGDLPNRAAILDLLPSDFDLSVFEPNLVLFSSEFGVAKPNKGIFEQAVSQSGLSGRQCLYCSENIVETLVAQHVGMLAIRVRPPPLTDLVVLEERILEYHEQI